MKNQSVMAESAQQSTENTKGRIPSSESALSIRLREAIGDESVVAFGRRCGLNESTLRKYFYGTLPNIENIIAIADAANVNIEWLAAGRGPKLRGASASIPMIPQAPPIPPSIFPIEDIERVEITIEAIEQALGARYTAMPVKKRAQLFAAVYDLLLDMDQRENIVKFIKLAA